MRKQSFILCACMAYFGEPSDRRNMERPMQGEQTVRRVVGTVSLAPVLARQSNTIELYLLGDPEVTVNMYCNFLYPY